MKAGTEFRFRDDLFRKDVKDDTVPIELITGPYKGVVLRYTVVSIEEKDDEALLNFGYELSETGDFTETTLRNDKEFVNYISGVLEHLIIECAKDAKSKSKE
jgi:hypothetical protein